MIPRTTTVGSLKTYRYNMNRSSYTMNTAMNKVITQRNFNSFAEDPAIASRCFQLRRSYLRANTQLNLTNSVYSKYQQAWSSLDSVSSDIARLQDDTAFGSILRAENGPTASGRNALGQSMIAKADSIIQTMNGRFGENFVFAGADTLNVPFTWHPKQNPDYIDPALAALADEELRHPRLEVIFTTSEEVGMDGAAALDVSMLRGHTLLNMDSEEEGILLAGCAGGCSAGIHLPLEREKRSGIHAVLTLQGLTGGHSGAEIHKGRGNANRLLSALLEELREQAEYRLISVEGGQKDNAIPRSCRAELMFDDKASWQKAEVYCREAEERLRKTYAGTDRELRLIFVKEGKKEAETFTEASFAHAMALLNRLPNGVLQMSGDIEGLVQTSLNLGILKAGEEGILAEFSVRSSVESAKHALIDELRAATELAGGGIEVTGDYPGWKFRKNSPLREKMISLYEKMYGAVPRVEAIHAGLECGILGSKIRDLDCVSMGPDMKDIHTTEETLSISSVKRVWEYLVALLEEKEQH